MSFSYHKQAKLMGERIKDALRVNFDHKLKPDGAKVASKAGLWAYREPDEAFGPSGVAELA